MAKLKARLSALKDKLTPVRISFRRAVRRYKAFRGREEAAAKKLEARVAKADKLRAAGKTTAAAYVDHEAAKLRHRQAKQAAKAQFWLGKVKARGRRLHGITTQIAKDEALVEAWKREHKIQVDPEGNKVTGGTPRQRLRVAIHVAANRCAKGLRPNFYSMPGEWTAKRLFVGELNYQRSDCSQFATSVYHACGLADPNHERYTGGYTGTLGANGKEIPEAEAQTGDLVLYGPYPHHHVEVVDDPVAKTTCGHGSPPIDAGVFDLFGDGDYIIRSYF